MHFWFKLSFLHEFVFSSPLCVPHYVKIPHYVSGRIETVPHYGGPTNPVFYGMSSFFSQKMDENAKNYFFHAKTDASKVKCKLIAVFHDNPNILLSVISNTAGKEGWVQK